jgi:hypothetical protein
MRCPSCQLIIDPSTVWKNSSNRFYCSEFCADSEMSAPVEQCAEGRPGSTVSGATAAAFAVFSGLKIEPSKSTIRGPAPMTTIVRLRGLFGTAEKVNGDSSSSLYCDHCRGKVRFPVHRYWRMRFCSAACINAYRRRLSPDTQRKI